MHGALAAQTYNAALMEFHVWIVTVAVCASVLLLEADQDAVGAKRQLQAFALRTQP